MNRLNLFVTDNYKDKSGEKKTYYTQVGNVVPHSKGGGFSVFIRPNISVSGELVIFPPKDEAFDEPAQRERSPDQWDDYIPF